MNGLIQLLSDMLGTRPEQKQLQEKFVSEGPEAIMSKYGLNEEQKQALRSGDLNKIGKQVVTELQKLTEGPPPNPNW